MYKCLNSYLYMTSCYCRCDTKCSINDHCLVRNRWIDHTSTIEEIYTLSRSGSYPIHTTHRHIWIGRRVNCRLFSKYSNLWLQSPSVDVIGNALINEITCINKLTMLEYLPIHGMIQRNIYHVLPPSHAMCTV